MGKSQFTVTHCPNSSKNDINGNDSSDDNDDDYLIHYIYSKIRNDPITSSKTLGSMVIFAFV